MDDSSSHIYSLGIRTSISTGNEISLLGLTTATGNNWQKIMFTKCLGGLLNSFQPTQRNTRSSTSAALHMLASEGIIHTVSGCMISISAPPQCLYVLRLAIKPQGVVVEAG